MLVLIGREGGGLHLGEQLAERLLWAHAGAQHQRVDEEADEALGLGVGAAGDGRADADVVLAGVAGEEQLEGGEQQHEGRGALPLGEAPQRVRQLRREVHGHRGAAPGLDGRTRAVRGQLQRGRRTGQLALPVAELRVQRLALQPLALPEGEVRVLHRQRCE
ncbi:hypothetical protein ASNO1_73870 [Corallococcus caeni]|uniref:Uncharacterized protein n=1 Tax=Corallococcus caeni TaxID=3082388 RepID=A0ABQ6R499_9BACT|nr:hypothetical protein ASNO1_73870 [Corallococcus sp. NO1]